jgi:outer membrane protein TolC
MGISGRQAWLAAAAVLGAAMLWAGCSATYYKEAADREVYQILASKQEKALGKAAGFTVEPTPESPLGEIKRPREAMPEATQAPNGLPRQEGAVLLPLRDALELAARYGREYQSRKEELYLAALTLTAERFRWQPQWSGNLSAGATRGPDDTYVRSGWDFGVSRLLALGGRLSFGLATDLLRYTTGDPRPSATSTATAEFLQPLWRGSGRLVAEESLTQAERDAVYAVRSFARFQRTFCVDITSRYYRVLQQRDAVINEWDNYQRIVQSRERAEATAQAGRLPEFQVDQARQDELRARDTWNRAVRQYQDQLDQFKVTLSLPTDAPMELDPKEIDRLRAAGLKPVDLSPEQVIELIELALGCRFDLLPACYLRIDAAFYIELALELRFDLLSVMDRVGDAERKVAIARKGLGPDAELKLTASIPSEPPTHAMKLEPHRGTYTGGLDVGLPLQRNAERNAYRQALIGLEQARRNAEELRDEIKLSVRGAARSLQETAESHRIQQASVKLAQRRVESTNLLLERGTATARDVLEANAALVSAQNALTRALIDHTLARLNLWRDTELLRVGDDGVWQEVTNVEN